MSGMGARRHTNDLFALFPDLPWTRMRTTEAQVAAVRRRVELTRARAAAAIDRQRAATERVRRAISVRRRRR
jgi:hypothetical protein